MTTIKMLSRARVAALTLAFLGAGEAVAQTADSAVIRVVRKARDAVVLIETYDEQGRPLGTGTGFFVDSLGTVVTNHHVVVGAMTARASNGQGEAYPIVGWIRASAEIDLATLKVQSAGPTPWLSLGSTAPPEPGTLLTVIGSPRGLSNTVTTGVSSGIQEVDGRRVLQLSASVSPGSSGSPVLDESAGVRGVVAAGRTDAPQVVYAVSGFDLGELIAERDTVKNLATVPGGPSARTKRSENPLAAPVGLTHMYQFQSLVGFPFAYIWLTETPSGVLSGAAFIQHPTGFVDVAPVQTGIRPGRRRAFEFKAGCGVFEGWIRDQGVLSGDVLNVCHDGSSSPFHAVPIGTPRGQRLNRVRPIRQYLVRTPMSDGSDGAVTWAWVTAVTPRDLGEGTVGAMHIWGSILGRPKRMELIFPRGRSDSTSLTLETADESTRLSVAERNGTITGALLSLADAGQQIQFEGYRDDLTYCFHRGEAKVVADSILTYLDGDDQVIRDSVSLVIKVLSSPELANPRSGMPLASGPSGPISDKERARREARAPYDSLLAALTHRRGVNANRRHLVNDDMKGITACPALPSERTQAKPDSTEAEAQRVEG